MADAMIQLALFAAKTGIILIFILLLLIMFLALFSKGKQQKSKAKIHIRNLNEKYDETKEYFYSETMSKREMKSLSKDKIKMEKSRGKVREKTKNIFVVDFHGDMKASAVDTLREEVTAIIQVATPKDEVVVRIESAGGVVHGYGFGAAQLNRFREHNIPLTVCIDKVAASGGYLMACVGNKILAAPFAIIGSIGVIVQLPNFHRLLKEKNIDFEQHTAGEFKRTITLFGENTEEGREKLQQEIEEVHQLFKNLIVQHRPQIDINRVATGEYWLGLQAIKMNLVDELKTSDEYLFQSSKKANVYEISYEIKKPLLSRLTSSLAKLNQNKFPQHGLPE